jgi:hypothetical protein
MAQQIILRSQQDVVDLLARPFAARALTLSARWSDHCGDPFSASVRMRSLLPEDRRHRTRSLMANATMVLRPWGNGHKAQRGEAA